MNNTSSEKGNDNTKAALFTVTQVTTMSSSISKCDSNSLMPTYDDNTDSNSLVFSIPSLASRHNESYSDTTIDTATVFSSKYFPTSQFLQHYNSDIDNDDISILTCIEKDFDFDEIYNTKEEIIQSTTPCPSIIADKYVKLK